MSFNRIQKLLFSEYRDFEDMVLVESPFAQTTRDGEGLRQVHLGLTPTKLILAMDVLPSAFDTSYVFQEPDIDPLIETLELVAIYPVECVNLSVFRRRKRQSLKARFCNNSICYFELGGFEKRTMFWNLWCERVKFLNPEDNKSIQSETSVATSTSTSTLRIESNYKINENGKRQIWLKYDCNEKNCRKNRSRLLRREIINREFELISENKSLVKSKYRLNRNSVSDVIISDRNLCKKYNSPPIYQTIQNGDVSVYYNVSSSCTTSIETLETAMDFRELLEIAVSNWEASKVRTLSKIEGVRGRHPRRYAFSPQPHFHHGLGPWNLHPGDRFSVQMKRSASAVRIRKPDPAVLTSISKKILACSISTGTLTEKLNTIGIHKLCSYKVPIIYFWTPEYWYRPQVAQDVYWEYIEHSRKLKLYFECRKKLKLKRPSEEEERISDAKEFRKIFDNIKSFDKSFSQANINDPYLEKHLSATQYMRRKLKINIIARAWDFDSSRLAYELTMIDKSLFMKIHDNELEAITWQQSTRNAPNISAIVAFSHRISCLVCTEILREESIQMRARLIVRFINVAQKCKELNNFQSCISILNGLQSVPIYRLHHTWGHLRKYHSIKYLLFEALCRDCNDARTKTYQRNFNLAARNPPFLPSIADFFHKLFHNPSLTIMKKKDSPSNANKLDPSKEIKVLFGDQKLGGGDSKPNQTKPGFLSSSRITDVLSTLRGWRSSSLRKTKHKTKFTETTQEDESHKLKLNNEDQTSFNQYFGWDRENRKENLKKTIEFLHVCKEGAKFYALTTSDLTKEYLLKARYREDRENYSYSFRLESK